MIAIRRSKPLTNVGRHFYSSSSSSVQNILQQLGLDASPGKVIPGVFDGETWKASGEVVDCLNPATNESLAKVQLGTEQDLERCLSNINTAKRAWANMPAPKRGNIVRQIGDELRTKLEPLGSLISLEMGKIKAEGVGEVQEYVDICEYAVGLSRMISGKSLPSERPDHSLIEVWNPLGSVGIITAFNFPCAVAGWNTAISLVCGNTQIVKGSETTSLVNIATQKIVTSILQKNNVDTKIAVLCQGVGKTVGEKMIRDPRLDMISFTGSTAVGKHIQTVVGDRFGKVLLELGGNNAVIVQDNVRDTKTGLQNALNSVLFASVGTCGQRCTSLRRLLLHENIYDEFLSKLKQMYEKVLDGNNKRIGNPLEKQVLVGPIHTAAAATKFEQKIKEIQAQGGKILCGGKRVPPAALPSGTQKGNYVYPTLVEISHDKKIVFEENFMPILYVMKYKALEDAIALNNSVEQGLSSALFTNSVQDTFKWIGPLGSDAGIINVNTSCSGAEIGGAFGGNKHTGWGRESGSDAWKQYMRRGTCTINYGASVPLAQGLDFSA